MKLDVVIFDLDGVVIDSSHIIRTAYERAGAKPPHNILAQEGTNWLQKQVGDELAPIIHARKNQIYQELIVSGEASLLSGFFTAQRLVVNGFYPMLLTAAPSGTIEVVKHWLGIYSWPFYGGWDAMKTSAKMIFMRRLALKGRIGVYIDDQDKSIDTPIGWRFIHYKGQPLDILYREITE